MDKVIIKNKKLADINADMIGLFFEDINYAADGGLYCEMIENYNFEAMMTTGDGADVPYEPVYDGLYGWEPYPYEGEGAMLETLEEDSVSKVNTHYLTFTSSHSQYGFTNKAYDGIYLTAGEKYKLSLYMRGKLGYDGGVKMVIDYFGEITEEITIAEENTVSEEWKKYEIVFTAKEDVMAGTFAICLSKQGRVEFDFISLKPENAVMKIFRRDLVEMLKELKPGFLRFPGGCIVEGNTIENRYRWKDSIGRTEDRKNNWNRWAVHGNNKENNYHSEYSHYNQTLGLGYYEYFLLCEYLGCKPLPVANVGTACQFMSKEHINTEDEAFNEYIQDVLDLIEFANGDENTVWGRKRAELGHKEPFGLDMIGIGNEQWESEDFDFFHRYDIFAKILMDKHPEIRLIGSAGPFVGEKHYDDAWRNFREKQETYGADISKYVYAVDEHYYQKPEWMLENTRFYDEYPRNIKVFAGEYATHIVPGSFNNPSSNNLYAALTEAAFMTGIERNADVVVLASYAPLFARMGYTQWSPDLIWFDGKDAYRTPSYYVQKFYSTYKGKQVVEGEFPDNIYGVASYNDDEGCLYLKIINVNDTDMETEILLEGFEKIKKITEISISDENREAYNSLEDTKRIAPKETAIILDGDKYKMKKYSFNILKIEF